MNKTAIQDPEEPHFFNYIFYNRWINYWNKMLMDKKENRKR